MGTSLSKDCSYISQLVFVRTQGGPTITPYMCLLLEPLKRELRSQVVGDHNIYLIINQTTMVETHPGQERPALTMTVPEASVQRPALYPPAGSSQLVFLLQKHLRIYLSWGRGGCKGETRSATLIDISPTPPAPGQKTSGAGNEAQALALCLKFSFAGENLWAVLLPLTPVFEFRLRKPIL